MSDIPQDKIAARLRRYYLHLKRNVAYAQEHEYIQNETRKIAATAQSAERFEFPGMFDVRAKWLRAEGVLGLMESKANAIDLLCWSINDDKAFLQWYVTLFEKVDARMAGLLALGDATLLLARAITLGCWEAADQIAELIQSGLVKRRKLPGKRQLICAFYTDVTCVDSFLLHLYMQWRGTSFALEGLTVKPMQAYAALLTLWQTDDLTVLEPAILAACDLHMKYSTVSEVETPVFGDEEDILHPVEILAVLRLREQRGLSNPSIDHPLLHTPAGKLLEMKSLCYADDLLEKAAANILATIT
jgi:hypothetical protein